MSQPVRRPGRHRHRRRPRHRPRARAEPRPAGRQGRRQRPRRQRSTAPAATSRPAQQVVEEIDGDGRRGDRQRRRRRRLGGRRSAWSTPPIETFGDLHVVVNNAGILRDRMLTNMTEEEWDAVINVHLKGTFAPSRMGRRVLAGAGQGGQAGRRPDHQHHVGVGHLRQPRPDELRRGQGRHRRVHRTSPPSSWRATA